MSSPESISWNLEEVKVDLMHAANDCKHRGLNHGAKWTAELNFSIKTIKMNSTILASVQEPPGVTADDYDNYLMAKSFFDLKEYDRAAHFTEDCSSEVCVFLHLYSKYLSAEKKRVDSETEVMKSSATPTAAANNQPQNLQGQSKSGSGDSLAALRNLRVEMRKLDTLGKLDGFGLYLYGVVLKKLDLTEEATTALLKAVGDTPLHWGAWLELSALVNDRDALKALQLPDHWMRFFFLAYSYLELQLNEQALALYQELSKVGFGESTHVVAQMALAYHNMRDVDVAVDAFKNLLELDPFRLENMDSYSNLLYVKAVRPELCFLAHRMVDIDKYRVETCCVVGNYYSLRGEHQKAVFYFQRALKLNPQYLSAWTLMGHEFMEMKNTAAAIQAYRHAIEVNRKDYRAWYGLGQTYELLKMSHYCLYYYRQAQYLRPNDSRMCVALGNAYEKLERLQEAKKCYWHAHCVGDVEGEAIVSLAKLYEKSNEDDQAASAFSRYVQDSETEGILKFEDLSHAYSFLANYFLKRRSLEEAYYNAQKCTEFNETREMGKSLLKQIAHFRSLETATHHLNASAFTGGNVSTSMAGNDTIPGPSDGAGDHSVASDAGELSLHRQLRRSPLKTMGQGMATTSYANDGSFSSSTDGGVSSSSISHSAFHDSSLGGGGGGGGGGRSGLENASNISRDQEDPPPPHSMT